MVSILSPVGYASSTCGYCGQGKTSRAYGVWAHRLTPAHYQQLVDRGWRRSGEYVYKPDNDRTCCAQHPIRLDAHAFRAGKAHRRALGDLLFALRKRPKPAKWKGSWSRGRTWNVEHRWDEIEASTPWAERVAGPATKRLEVHLQLAASSAEKYALYRKYQARIHGEVDNSLQSFERFLVHSSLVLTLPSTGQPLSERDEAHWKHRRFRVASLPSELPYGCYHQEYRLDGQLIAVGVLDILPQCVSSVYVFYDPDYADWQLGKVSALQEIALVRRLSALPAMHATRFYYMGFYIASCQKMRYKAQYKPSQLLDTHTNTWHDLTHDPAPPRIDATPHNSERIPTPPPPGMLDPARLFRIVDALRAERPADDMTAKALLEKAFALEAKRQHQGIKPLLMSAPAQEYCAKGESEDFAQALDCIAALADANLVQQTVLFV